MKHDNTGESQKPIAGTVSSPKSVPNHGKIPNTNTGEAKDTAPQQIANTVSGPKKG